jgi:hypothetical protein
MMSLLAPMPIDPWRMHNMQRCADFAAACLSLASMLALCDRQACLVVPFDFQNPVDRLWFHAVLLQPGAVAH